MFDAFSDGFTDTGRNCHCGSGVYVIVDEYHGKCGVCGSTKLTQAGINRKFREENPEEYARIYSHVLNQDE